MKRSALRIAIVLLVTPLIAQADLTLVQTSDGPGARNPSVMKVKGGKVRVDSGTDLTSIFDTVSGDLAVLNHTTKEVAHSNLKTGPAAAAIAAAAAAARTHRPLATGKMEKLGEHECEIYEWDLGGGIKTRLWVARAYPGYEQIKSDLAALAKMSGGNVLQELPGMVMQSQADLGGAVSTTKLMDVKTTPLADTEFMVPTGYKPALAEGGR